MANAGCLKGAEMLDRLIKEGVMPKGSGYADMEAGVAQGKVAMMIATNNHRSFCVAAWLVSCTRSFMAFVILRRVAAEPHCLCE